MNKNFFFLFIFLLQVSLLPQESVIPDAPNNKGLEIFSEAMNEYNSTLYSEAYRLFDKFFSEYQLKDELYATAKFYSADALLNMGDKDAASSGFEYLVNNFSTSNFRDRALFKLGQLYFDSKQYSKARARFEKLLYEYPNSEHSGTALYWIGESYAAENKLDEAIKYLENAVADKKNNKFEDYSIYTLASVFEKTGDYENAVKYYDQLLSFHKDSPLAVSSQIRIGVCYFKLKDYQSSILELNSPLLSDLPDDLYAQSLYLLANSYYRVKEYKDAERSYKEILDNFPSTEYTRDAQYGLAWTYFQQEKYNDAYKVFHSLSDGEDTIALKSYYWKAEAKRYAGQEDEAFRIYKEFVEKFPNNELVKGVQYQMGVTYFNNGQLNQAERLIKDALSSSDEALKAKAFTLLGEIELNRKQYESAKNSFDAALEINEISPDLKNRSMLGLGASYYYLGSFNDAIETLKEVEDKNPNFEPNKVNFYLAESFYSLGKFSDAINKYNNIDPTETEIGTQALYGKGYSYFNLKDFDNAAYAFNDFVKKYPKDKRIVDARLRLADSYYGSKNYDAASRVYKELFNLGGGEIENPYAYYQYAQALYKAGNISQALDEFRNLQQKFPESDYGDESLFTVAWIHFQQADYADAISSYRNVLNVYPQSPLAPIVYYSIGDSYFNTGKYDSAIVNYQIVMAEYPTSNYVFDAVNGIQYSYAAKGDYKKAISFIDQFVSSNPGLSFSDQIFFKKGEIYYSARDYDAAKLSYQEFISNYPKSKLIPDAYYWIGKSAQNLNHDDEAIFNFNKLFESYPQSDAAADAVIEMGNIYNASKNYNAAIEIYDKALDKLSQSPRMAEILFNKGTTLINKEDYTNAYDVFDEVIQYFGKTIFADKSKFEIGLIDLATENYTNADLNFQSLAESKSDDLGAKAQYYLGVSLFEQEKYEEAITALERVRLVFSAYDEWLTKSYLKIGDCYTKLEQYDKAKEMYRAVLSKHRGNMFGQEAQSKLRDLQ